jgi:predicted RNA-binding Zn ribbon-like protein
MGHAAKIASHGPGRHGTCRAEGCERVFFDTTANGSRRYCSDRCAGRPSVTAACHPTSPRVTVPARETDR